MSDLSCFMPNELSRVFKHQSRRIYSEEIHVKFIFGCTVSLRRVAYGVCVRECDHMC